MRALCALLALAVGARATTNAPTTDRRLCGGRSDPDPDDAVADAPPDAGGRVGLAVVCAVAGADDVPDARAVEAVRRVVQAGGLQHEHGRAAQHRGAAILVRTATGRRAANPDKGYQTSGQRKGGGRVLQRGTSAGGHVLVRVRKAVNLPNTDGDYDGGLISGETDPYVQVQITNSLAETHKIDSCSGSPGVCGTNGSTSARTCRASSRSTSRCGTTTQASSQ